MASKAKPTMMFIDLLQDNEGHIYWFMFSLDTYKAMNFKFWEFLEFMDDFNIIFRPADCQKCPMLEENDDEDKEDLS